MHRVGRTARAGRQGLALIYLLPKEDAYISFLRARLIPIEPLPAEELRNVLTAGDAAGSASQTASSEQDSLIPSLNILQEIRNLAMADRDVMEKGQAAYVSFVRAYKVTCIFDMSYSILNFQEHQCTFIFVLVPIVTYNNEKCCFFC